MKEFVLSDSSINCLGIRLLSNGGDFSQFEKNPIMLYHHDQEKVLGQWIDLTLVGDEWRAKAKFDSEDDAFAASIEKKVNKGTLKMASIKADIIDAILVIEDGKEIIHATKWKAIEASIVPVGGNDNALALSYKGKCIKNKQQIIELGLSSEVQLPEIQNLNMKRIALALDLDEAASEAAVEKALQKVLAKAKAAEQRAADLESKNIALSNNMKTLEDKIAEIEAKAKDDKATQLVESAFAQGKISATEKDSFIALAKADFDNTKKILDAKKAHVSITEQMQGNKNNEEKYKGWSFSDFHKKDSVELARIRTEEPERYAELLTTLKSNK